MQSAPNPARDARSILLIAAIFGAAAGLLLFLGSHVSDFDASHAVFTGAVLAFSGTLVSLTWAFAKIAPAIPPKLAATFRVALTRRRVLCHGLLTLAATALLHAGHHVYAVARAQTLFAQLQGASFQFVLLPDDIPDYAAFFFPPPPGLKKGAVVYANRLPPGTQKRDWYEQWAIRRAHERLAAGPLHAPFSRDRAIATLRQPPPATFTQAVPENAREIDAFLSNYAHVYKDFTGTFHYTDAHLHIHLTDQPLLRLGNGVGKPFTYAVANDALWLRSRSIDLLFLPDVTVRLSHGDDDFVDEDSIAHPLFRTLPGYLLTFFLASLLTLAPFHYIARRKTATNPQPSAPL